MAVKYDTKLEWWKGNCSTSFCMAGGGLSEQPSSESLQSARKAGLRYVDDRQPGIRRIRRGRGFTYVDTHGRFIRDRRKLKHIASLVIPPAWQRVWICPQSCGHIQAIGWDSKGRKQYRYHAEYRAVRDRNKFDRMIAFGTVLALMRGRIARDLRRPGLPREKVLAAAVRLLQTTYVRVGNTEYEKQNGSYGLTTLRNKHVRLERGTLCLDFKGKSGLRHVIEVHDRRLARVVCQCQDLPGYRLFEYLDDQGVVCTVDSGDINDYVRQVTGQEFTAKDFRTWAGTFLATRAFADLGPAANQRELKTKVAAAVKRVSEQLGNRPATCRKYYIHPAIFDAYSDNSLFEVMREGIEQQRAYGGRGLQAEEYSVMVVIAKHLEKRTSAIHGGAVRKTKAA